MLFLVGYIDLPCILLAKQDFRGSATVWEPTQALLGTLAESKPLRSSLGQKGSAVSPAERPRSTFLLSLAI